MSTATKHFLRSSLSASLLRTPAAAPTTAITSSVSSLARFRPPLPTPSFSSPSSYFHTSAAKMTVHEFKSAADFEKAVKEYDVVLVDCTASWCGPCKMISPVFDKLSEEADNQKIHFAKFDVDEIPELAAKLNVRAMPTFKAFKKDNLNPEEPVEEMMGANPPALTALIAKFK